MKRETIVVAAPGRLDLFLARAFPGMSRQFWKQRIADGSVQVDAALPRKADFQLKGGETVDVTLGADAAPGLDARVIHEDDAILVLDKPSGLIAHPLGTSWLKTPAALEAEADSLAGWLWRHRPANRALVRLGIVHRLDQGTSGVMVVAKTPEAQQSLLDQFRERKVEKRYRALVAGRIRAKLLKISAAVGRKGHERKISADPAGRPALTDVHVLKTATAVSLVEARPKTGRTHQIRVHLASVGHPVLGDREWIQTEAMEKFAAPRLMLHAYRLAFLHPATGKRAAYEAKLPKEFNACWKRLAGK